MKRGELYRTSTTPDRDPRPYRVYLVLSRQESIDSNYSTVVCAPVYSQRSGLLTEVLIGPDEGLLHESSARCDDLISVPKRALTNYVGSLGPGKLAELKRALIVALDLED